MSKIPVDPQMLPDKILCDRLFAEGFLKRTSSRGELRQIISLGAGFDSTFFRLKSLGLIENCIFYEVDFPKVVKRKADIIEQIPELKSLIGNNTCLIQIDCAELFRDDYRLLGVDMTQVKVLDDAFRQSGTNVSCPTLILSECVLTYLTPQHSDAVIQWAAETFTNSVFVDYEQTNPDTAFGSVMTRHFESNGSQLKCINTYCNIQSHKERFLKLGWSFCECSDMNAAYDNLISEEEKEKLEQLELFDEFEEFHLTCCHYMILCAHKQNLQPYLYYTTYLSSETEMFSLTDEISVKYASTKMTDTQKTLLKRFGHSCILSSDGLVFLFGGFGKENGKFQRVSNLVIYDVKSSEVTSLAVPQNLPESHFSQMYQSICQSTDKSMILFAGRKSPGKPNSSVTVVQVKNLEEASQKVESKYEAKGTSAMSDLEFSLGSKTYRVSCEELETKGDVPLPRWRHSSSIFEKNGLPMMFIYGGRNQHGSITLKDGFVLNLQTKHWTKMEFLGDEKIPNNLHSHTCTTWRKDQYLILAGGLLQSIPSCDIYLLDVSSFIVKKLKISGTLYPRYSHTAHIVGDHLLLVGGVNLLPFSPGVAVINLLTGFSQEFTLPVTTEFSEIEMVHNHQSIIFEESWQLGIIGGGGNCFSFGTHLNNSLIWIDLEQFGISKLK